MWWFNNFSETFNLWFLFHNHKYMFRYVSDRLDMDYYSGKIKLVVSMQWFKYFDQFTFNSKASLFHIITVYIMMMLYHNGEIKPAICTPWFNNFNNISVRWSHRVGFATRCLANNTPDFVRIVMVYAQKGVQVDREKIYSCIYFLRESLFKMCCIELIFLAVSFSLFSIE